MPYVHGARPGRRNGGAGDLRHRNLTEILRYVRDHGPSSRHDIADGCGLGVSTMTDLVGELRSRRLVRELDALRRPGAGRPTRPIALDGDPWCVLGVQVDPLEVLVLCTTVGGRELFRERLPIRLLHTAGEEGFPLLRDGLCGELRHIPGDVNLVAVQFGLPGHVATDRGTVGGSTWLNWRGLPLETLIYDTLYASGIEDVAVGITHDCHLAALHAVREELHLPLPPVAVYLGGLREVGGGVVLDGEIFEGAAGGAGDFGHLNVDPAGPPCRCGRHGCLNSLIGPERLLVGSGLADPEEAARLVAEEPLAVLQRLRDAARTADPRLRPVLAAAGEALDAALDDVIGAFNPQVVVLGGYLGVLEPYLAEHARPRTAGRVDVETFAGTSLVALGQARPRVLLGAALAARDACLADPLTLTHVA